jgi:hypothetical protein
MALFIMQSLLSAVDDLLSFGSESLEDLLARLEREEKEHYERSLQQLDAFIASETLKEEIPKEMGYSSMDKLPVSDLDVVSTVLGGESICHTVRLPSRIRYLGYLTNTDKVGGPSVYGEETFDIGMELQEAKSMTNSTIKSLQLIWDANESFRRQECPLIIAPDAKDSWYFQFGDGWRELRIPNEATRSAYRYNSSIMKGIVIMILRNCDWGQCETGFLTADDFGGNETGWEMMVNGMRVTALSDIGNGAIVVQNEHGITFPQGSNGEYKLDFHVTKPSHFLKLSSVIIF